MSIEKTIRNWMWNELNANTDEYFDSAGEPQYTHLAEQAAWALDPEDTWLDDETHIVWDLAVDILDEFAVSASMVSRMGKTDPVKTGSWKDAPIANPADYESRDGYVQNLLYFTFGVYGETQVFVWGDSVEQALNEAVAWLEETHPNHEVLVTDQELRELYGNAKMEMGSDAPDYEVEEEAFVDLTWANDRYIDHTWTVNDVYDDELIEKTVERSEAEIFGEHDTSVREHEGAYEADTTLLINSFQKLERAQDFDEIVSTLRDIVDSASGILDDMGASARVRESAYEADTTLLINSFQKLQHAKDRDDIVSMLRDIVDSASGILQDMGATARTGARMISKPPLEAAQEMLKLIKDIKAESNLRELPSKRAADMVYDQVLYLIEELEAEQSASRRSAGLSGWTEYFHCRTFLDCCMQSAYSYVAYHEPSETMDDCDWLEDSKEKAEFATYSREDFEELVDEAFSDVHDDLREALQKMIDEWSVKVGEAASKYLNNRDDLSDDQKELAYDLIMDEEESLIWLWQEEAGSGVGTWDRDTGPWAEGGELNEMGITGKDIIDLIGGGFTLDEMVSNEASLIISKMCELVHDEVSGE